MKTKFTSLALFLGLGWGVDVLAETHVVGMAQKGAKMLFVPETLTIKVGDTVKWVNNDPTQMPHMVTSGVVKNNSPQPNNLFDSKWMMSGATFEHTFTKAGTFPYYCLPHISMGMVGTVVVK